MLVMDTVTVSHADHTYTANIDGRAVVIDRDGVYAGRGKLSGGRIEDCPAILADGAYSALEAAIVNGLIEEQARESADMCLSNGWDPAGDLYDLTSMQGDRQALDERLGRRSTVDEQRALELRIRQIIAR